MVEIRLWKLGDIGMIENREHIRIKKPELLIPAGNLEILKVAVDYGADAVYIGGQKFGLRAKADNFSVAEMAEGADYAHAAGAKLYVAVNIFAHNEDIEGIRSYFLKLLETGLERKIDAFIISDFGVFTLAKEMLPQVEIHISTQANNTNYMTCKFWYDMGAARVVVARELSLREIRDIRERIPDALELEAFMHGAMCISYSGRCLLSSYFTGRDANQGACTHPCRWKYAVVEEKRPGEYLPVEEDDRGTYIFNSKDLNMIHHIPEMIEAGVGSFKVEGRMKTALYVAVVARTYRQAIDDYYAGEKLYQSRDRQEYYDREISACTYRQFTTGFYFDKPDADAQIYDNNTYVKNRVYLGIIEEITERNLLIIRQKNKFCVGDKIEIMLFDGANKTVTVEGIFDEKMIPMESAPHPKQLLYVRVDDMEGIKTGMVMRTEHCEA